MIRTVLHTRRATDAFFVVDIYYAVVLLVSCLGGTDVHAGWLITVVAKHRHEDSDYFRELANLFVENTRIEDSCR
jgi:hypothetical protein